MTHPEPTHPEPSGSGRHHPTPRPIPPPPTPPPPPYRLLAAGLLMAVPALGTVAGLIAAGGRPW